MRNRFLSTAALPLLLCIAASTWANGEIRQVPFTDVQVNDLFWKQRLDVMLRCAKRAADNMLSVFGEDGINRGGKGHGARGKRIALAVGILLLLAPCSLPLMRFHVAKQGERVNGMYWQDHLPAVEQREAVGHAVRAMYFVKL